MKKTFVEIAIDEPLSAVEEALETHKPKNPDLLKAAHRAGSPEVRRFLIDLATKRKITSKAVTDAHAAAIGGTRADFEQAKKRKVDFGAPSTVFSQMTPLIIAASHGHVEMVELLLEDGVKASMESGRYTALSMAVSKHHTEVVKILIERKINCDDGRTLWALRPSTPVEILDILLSAKLDLNAESPKAGRAIKKIFGAPDVKIEQAIQLAERLVKGGLTVSADVVADMILAMRDRKGSDQVMEKLLSGCSDDLNEPIKARGVRGTYTTVMEAALFESTIEVIKQIANYGVAIPTSFHLQNYVPDFEDKKAWLDEQGSESTVESLEDFLALWGSSLTVKQINTWLFGENRTLGGIAIGDELASIDEHGLGVQRPGYHSHSLEIEYQDGIVSAVYYKLKTWDYAFASKVFNMCNSALEERFKTVGIEVIYAYHEEGTFELRLIEHSDPDGFEEFFCVNLSLLPGSVASKST